MNETRLRLLDALITFDEAEVVALQLLARYAGSWETPRWEELMSDVAELHARACALRERLVPRDRRGRRSDDT